MNKQINQKMEKMQFTLDGILNTKNITRSEIEPIIRDLEKDLKEIKIMCTKQEK
jgi:hypothetical protein